MHGIVIHTLLFAIGTTIILFLGDIIDIFGGIAR